MTGAKTQAVHAQSPLPTYKPFNVAAHGQSQGAGVDGVHAPEGGKPDALAEPQLELTWC